MRTSGAFDARTRDTVNLPGGQRLEELLFPLPRSTLDKEDELDLTALVSRGEGKVVPTSLVWRRVPLLTISR